MQIKFPTGAEIVVEAPARLRVELANGVSLLSGKLTAVVPPAGHGFAVKCPDATVVDLGTEFGVNVHSNGLTDVDVFKGRVLLTAVLSSPGEKSETAGPSATLYAGSASRISSGGGISPITSNADAYISPDAFDRLLAMPIAGSIERWKEYNDHLRNDPDLVVCYTFDKHDANPQRLVNHAGSGTAMDGILLEGPRWTTGRWPVKGALSFDSDTRERVQIQAAMGGPLDFSRRQRTAAPFTVCLWLLAGEQRPAHSSILLKGGGAEQFSIELFPDRSIRGSVAKAYVGNSPSLASLANGNWQHVCLSYDPAHRIIALYVNGVEVAEELNAPVQMADTAAPLAIGSRIYQPGWASYLPPMIGRIDELEVFRRALSAEEVEEMYLAGKPD